MRRYNEGRTAQGKQQSCGNRSDELLHCGSSGFWAIEALTPSFDEKRVFSNPEGGWPGTAADEAKVE
jgi:hypothetical protein